MASERGREAADTRTFLRLCAPYPGDTLGRMAPWDPEGQGRAAPQLSVAQAMRGLPPALAARSAAAPPSLAKAAQSRVRGSAVQGLMAWDSPMALRSVDMSQL